MTDNAVEATLPIATGRQVRAVVFALVRQHRGRAAAVAILFLAASALGLAMPACLGRIVDAVSSHAGAPTIAVWVLGVAAGAIGAALVGLWGTRMLVGLVQDVLASLREEVFASAMRLPVSTVDDSESADLLSRVTGDVDAVAEAGGNVVPTLLSAAFAIMVSLIALAVLDPWLALAGVASVPFYVLGTRAFLRRSRVVFREVRLREAARSQAVIDAVDGRETLTALNEQHHALARVSERAERSIQVQIEGVHVRNRLFRWINGGEAVGLAAILATGFLLHSTGAITVGMVTTAALVFHRLFDPVGMLIFGLDDVQRAAIGLARLVGIIELVPDASAPSSARAVEATRGGPAAIELREVSFHYPATRRGISDITLRVEAGTTTAFVGTSGSGKSTLARLIAGHYLPTSGASLLQNHAVPYYISQELHHFRGSIADNMRLVAPDASIEQMSAALAAVGADWAIASLSVSVDDIGGSPDSHIPLDEGRIQQLAIARAFLSDCPVVILDEATADVGLQHRNAVESAISTLRERRTAVLIAHRLQQVTTADQIVVLADGRVAQRGTHAELLSADGAYRDFWLAQTSGDIPTDPHHHIQNPQEETETP